jgi:hypothetical protein
LFILRKINGTYLVKEDFKCLHEFQLKQLLVLNSNLINFNLTENELVNSKLFQRINTIISLLAPKDVLGKEYLRIGKDNDGGYVMVDHFENIQGAYSFGIATDVSWDEYFANKGINVYMFDHTINKLPKKNENFNFFKLGITGFEKIKDTQNLESLINLIGHQNAENLLLKMDVEGCEWDVLDEVESNILDQFSQIVIEFHDILPDTSTKQYEIMLKGLQKLNLTHQSIHVHANIAGGVPYVIGGLVLPTIIEVTFLRRKDFVKSFVSNSRNFPTNLDQPTLKNWPEISLGMFQSK